MSNKPDLFDEEAYVDEQVWPLIKQAHALCKERGIPFVAAACYASRESTWSINSSVHLEGAQRTPPAVLAAALAIRHDEAAKAATVIGLSIEMAQGGES